MWSPRVVAIFSSFKVDSVQMNYFSPTELIKNVKELFWTKEGHRKLIDYCRLPCYYWKDCLKVILSPVQTFMLLLNTAQANPLCTIVWTHVQYEFHTCLQSVIYLQFSSHMKQWTSHKTVCPNVMTEHTALHIAVFIL